MAKKIQLNERIFLAGANGMVGKTTYKLLKEYGYGGEGNNGKIFTPSREELDLLNLTEVQNWFSKNKPTVVIIAAAKVGGIYANTKFPADFILENIKIQTNIIETSWRFKVKRLLFLGSSCIYPKKAAQPIEEDSLLNGALETTNQWYAISKISGIKLCEALRSQYGFDAISLMPTNLYGPGDNYHPTNSHVMAALIKRFMDAKKKSLKSVICWGSGSPLREFMHVEDLGRAIIFVLENWDPDDDNAPVDNQGIPLTFLNVGTGKEVSIKELATKISAAVEYEGEIIWDESKPDGTPRKLLNIKNITSLGWTPQITLDDGIKKTIKQLKSE